MLRRLAGLAIGMLICDVSLFRRYKLFLLSSWQMEKKRNWFDNLIYPAVLSHWFRFKYLSETDPDQREWLKGICMGGEGSREWAREYQGRPLDLKARIGCLTCREAVPVLAELDELISRITEPVIVVQIGSSSGREIAYLARRNPLHRCIGTDIYPEVIDYASGCHPLPNLGFELCSAKEIADLLDRQDGQRIIVFSNGSLQYVQPEHLETFFDATGRISNLEVVLLEPADECGGDPRDLEGSRWRGNFSYTHNYLFYANRAGFATRRCEVIRPYLPYEDFPGHRGTVHYFYWGRHREQGVG